MKLMKCDEVEEGGSVLLNVSWMMCKGLKLAYL
jgi:hypothetical protein